MVRVLIGEPSLILKSHLNKYVNDVIENKDEFNYNTFDFEETPLDDIIDCLNSPCFSSARKVVIGKSPYFIKDEKAKLPFENDLTLLENYLDNPNPDTEFIIIVPNRFYNAKSKMLKKLEEVGATIENLMFSDELDFNRYGVSLIQRLNIQIDDDAIDILLSRCYGDVCKLEREIVKLSSYNDVIDKDLIQKFVAMPIEDNVFLLTDAILAKDVKRKMQIYYDLKRLKTEPVQLIAILASQFRLLLQVAILVDQGKGEADIAKTLGVHPYRVKLAMKNIYNYSVSKIKDILVKLSDLDVNIKNGTADRYLEFETFLASF